VIIKTTDQLLVILPQQSTLPQKRRSRQAINRAVLASHTFVWNDQQPFTIENAAAAPQ